MQAQQVLQYIGLMRAKEQEARPRNLSGWHSAFDPLKLVQKIVSYFCVGKMKLGGLFAKMMACLAIKQCSLKFLLK